MAATYEMIATTTLNSDQANITFTPLSSSYTDLIFVANFTLSGGSGGGVSMQFNSDPRFKYSTTRLIGDGSSATSGKFSSNNYIVPFPNMVRGSFSTLICHFNNYSNNTTYKTIVSRFGNAGSLTGATVSLWQVTDGIGTIFLSTEANGTVFNSGSVFTFYGIKAA